MKPVKQSNAHIKKDQNFIQIREQLVKKSCMQIRKMHKRL